MSSILLGYLLLSYIYFFNVQRGVCLILSFGTGYFRKKSKAIKKIKICWIKLDGYSPNCWFLSKIQFKVWGWGTTNWDLGRYYPRKNISFSKRPNLTCLVLLLIDMYKRFFLFHYDKIFWVFQMIKWTVVLD